MVRRDRPDAPALSTGLTPRGEADEEDRLLVARFVESRDEAAFRALYRRHASFLYRFLLRLSVGVEETSDLLDDFDQALRRGHNA